MNKYQLQFIELGEDASNPYNWHDGTIWGYDNVRDAVLALEAKRANESHLRWRLIERTLTVIA